MIRMTQQIKPEPHRCACDSDFSVRKRLYVDKVTGSMMQSSSGLPPVSNFFRGNLKPLIYRLARYCVMKKGLLYL